MINKNSRVLRTRERAVQISRSSPVSRSSGQRILCANSLTSAYSTCGISFVHSVSATPCRSLHLLNFYIPCFFSFIPYFIQHTKKGTNLLIYCPIKYKSVATQCLHFISILFSSKNQFICRHSFPALYIILKGKLPFCKRRCVRKMTTFEN